MVEFETFGPLLLSAGFMLCLFVLFGRESALCRAITASLCIFLVLRYLFWHATLGMPEGQSPIQQAWAWIFFFFESMSNLSSIFVYFFMSRTKDRSSSADAAQNSLLLGAPVDVFIATYNEPASVLERTIVGALAIDHPDLRVFVLDDGARPFVHELASELGANYISRVKGKHAKAGNINNALSIALSKGRRPAFILLLDADFVPHRDILWRTLGLFGDHDVGIVQTPQHFFNNDPIQANLLISNAWPDEQRFFFDTLMPSLDAWGVSFCCGTSAVLRVSALLATGGMATETVTEDMLTSFKMEEHGYRTIYLNEPLSTGLAPEDLQAYVTQRCRWCLGSIQQIYTKWSFAGSARLRFLTRLAAFDTVLYCLFSFPYRILILISPMIYWWTGTSVIATSASGIIYWLVPSAACGLVFLSFYSGNRILPVLTDVSQLLSSFPIMRTVFAGLIKPFGRPFKVTPKGLPTAGILVRWEYLLPFLLIVLGSLSGILANLSGYSALRTGGGFEANVFWSVYNIAVLLLATLVCIELPQSRTDERFATNEAAFIKGDDGETSFCRLVDLSLGGAQIEGSPPPWARGNGKGILVLDQGALEVPFRFVALNDSQTSQPRFAVCFEAEKWVRRSLIRKLFCGNSRQSVKDVDAGRVIFALSKRVLR